MNARSAVMRQYAAAQEHFSEEDQRAHDAGNEPESAGNRQFALWCLRAYRVELDDPKPRPPELAPCGACPVRECDLCVMCRVRTIA